MAFKGKRAGSWGEASAVYGKSGDAWLYAKNVYGKKDGVWSNAWTDCRQHDAGGRDWTVAAGVTEYQLTCNNRQSRVRTDYTKTGCTPYSRYTDWVSSPDCNADCFTSSTATVYSGSCNNRTSATRTTYTAKAGSGCTTYFTDGTYTASPDCNSGCFTSSTSTVYRNSCANRETATRTTYTANAGSGCTTYFTDGTYTASSDCNSGCFDASAVNCDGCGSATLYTAKAGSGCTTYTSGSCGTWTDIYSLSETFAVSGGTYSYVTGSLWGWGYSDAAGNFIYNSSCGGLAAPVNVQACGSSYRVTGGDTCIYPSCC